MMVKLGTDHQQKKDKVENRITIIAEAGVNHNGDINRAYELIDVAAEAGADYVKFQTFKTENLVTKSVQKAKYQTENTKEAGSQFEMLKKLEIDKETHINLMKYCAQKNIKFLSTAFDLDSIDLLNELGLELFKIPSGELTNLPYLEKIGQTQKPIILSTGMATIDEIKESVEVLNTFSQNNSQLVVLHCNTEYPTPMKDVNLLAMLTMKQELGLDVGYSDHTEGIEVSLAAAALGATVIEKHFTTDNTLPGPDHKASLNPKQLKELVKGIRNIELALGSEEKSPSDSERQNMSAMRKSIVCIQTIRKGESFTEQNIGVKRPGNGISPMQWHTILGQKAAQDFEVDELIVTPSKLKL